MQLTEDELHSLDSPHDGGDAVVLAGLVGRLTKNIADVYALLEESRAIRRQLRAAAKTLGETAVEKDAEIERLEKVVRLAGRKLSACGEYAGQDQHLIVNKLLHEAAEAEKKPVYRGHQYDPMDSEGLSGGRDGETAEAKGGETDG